MATLVGRRAESVEVKRLLSRSRLVTLTGPGGVGKTRLALHVGRSVQSAFDDGVWMVPLAELSEPDLIASVVMARLGASGTDVEELVKHLDDQYMLLILDNCEHLAEAVAGIVSEVLERCPHLRVLATSRAALRVGGEALYPVPTLSLPAPGARAAADALSYDAVALFLDRASLLNPDFDATRVDKDAVVALCQRLDGLPLAIELAAASTRWLSIPELLGRSSDLLSPVADSPRSAPDRHQSLRASLDYSRDLCSPEAQRLWGRLSVFRGGARLPAIEAVCGEGDPQRASVGPALFELVDKSIVRLTGSRYRMLEIIRQYGEDLLTRSDQTRVVREAHLAYFAAMADDLNCDWFGPKQAELSSRLYDEQANVRAALAFAVDNPALVGIGLRMASSLWGFWIGSGLPSEGRLWLSRLLAADGHGTPERATALWVHGFLTVVDGDIPGARITLAECIRAAEGVDEASLAHATNALGMADVFEGRIAQGIEHLTEAVRLERRLDATSEHLADALSNLGLALCYSGDLDAAISVLEESRAICVSRGEQLLQSWTLAFLGLARLLGGHPEEATVLASRSLELKRSLDNQQGMSWAGDILAWALLEQGEAQRAAVLLGACEVRSAELGPLFHGFPGMHEWHSSYSSRARKILGDAAFERASERGRALTLEEMVSTALGETPAEQGAASEPARPEWSKSLTSREFEIAALVASGRTNREIAATLVIALRTVDTHVQHILTKLGFTSRSQIAAVMASTKSPTT